MSLPNEFDLFRDLLLHGVAPKRAHAFTLSYRALVSTEPGSARADRSMLRELIGVLKRFAARASGRRRSRAFEARGYIVRLPSDPADISAVGDLYVRPGDLANIPDPVCVASHLPRDRKPTRQEVDDAISQCLRKAPRLQGI